MEKKMKKKEKKKKKKKKKMMRVVELVLVVRRRSSKGGDAETLQATDSCTIDFGTRVKKETKVWRSGELLQD